MNRSGRILAFRLFHPIPVDLSTRLIPVGNKFFVSVVNLNRPKKLFLVMLCLCVDLQEGGCDRGFGGEE